MRQGKCLQWKVNHLGAFHKVEHSVNVKVVERVFVTFQEHIGGQKPGRKEIIPGHS